MPYRKVIRRPAKDPATPAVDDDPTVLRCAFHDTDALCQAAATHGIYAGYNNNVVARVCAEHVNEGKQQVQSQHPDWVLNSAALPAPVRVSPYKGTDWSRIRTPRTWTGSGWTIAVVAAVVAMGLVFLVLRSATGNAGRSDGGDSSSQPSANPLLACGRKLTPNIQVLCFFCQQPRTGLVRV